MKKIIYKLLKRIRLFLISPILSSIDKKERTTHTLLQNILQIHYQLLKECGFKMPRFEKVGFSVYSESDEDGILHYIFSLIGTVNKKLVDIGSGSIYGSNSANLIINHGWFGLLIDGNKDVLKFNKDFYSECDSTRYYPPRIIQSKVNAENINNILADNHIAGEIDLLCIDIDGIDYWIWNAITVIRPRVVLIEYQCIWGPEIAKTVPYNPDFKPELIGGFGVYCGASLRAFVKLGKMKGYRLIGCQRYGYNAFFIRNDIGIEIFPEISPENCFIHPFTDWARNEFIEKIIEKKWTEI